MMSQGESKGCNHFLPWEVDEVNVYQPLENAIWPPTTLADLEPIVRKENLIQSVSGLVEGAEVQVGLSSAVVKYHSEDGTPYAVSLDGKRMHLLYFKTSAQPPRWVCVDSVRIRYPKN